MEGWRRSSQSVEPRCFERAADERVDLCLELEDEWSGGERCWVMCLSQAQADWEPVRTLLWCERTFQCWKGFHRVGRWARGECRSAHLLGECAERSVFAVRPVRPGVPAGRQRTTRPAHSTWDTVCTSLLDGVSVRGPGRTGPSRTGHSSGDAQVEPCRACPERTP